MTYVSPYIDIFGVEDTYVIKPEFFRSVAGKKRPITNVSYTPLSKKNLDYNMLWCIYTGRNAVYDVLSPMVKVLDKLYIAGWEPVTAATMESSTDTNNVRIERYGNKRSDTVYYVVHNMGLDSVEFDLNFDKLRIGMRKHAQVIYNGDIGQAISEEKVTSLILGNRETKVIGLTY